MYTRPDCYATSLYIGLLLLKFLIYFLLQTMGTKMIEISAEGFLRSVHHIQKAVFVFLHSVKFANRQTVADHVSLVHH